MATFPGELSTLRQWVAYRLAPSQKRPGKTDKIPVDPATGEHASTTDPATWGTLAEAQDRASRAHLAGVGFVFSEHDPYAGCDLDDCLTDGEPQPWARAILERLGSYAERSQSGTGLHIIFRAALPPGGRVNHRAGVELYDAGRFFAMTGAALPGYPAIADRQAELEALHAELFPKPAAKATTTTPRPVLNLSDNEIVSKLTSSKNGALYAALWAGKTSGYSSPSEADAALVNGLAFYAGGDAPTVDRLFRSSGLYRDKWDKVTYRDGRTYGAATVDYILGRMTEFYHGNGHGPASTYREAPEEPGWLRGSDGAPELAGSGATPPQHADRFRLRWARDALQPQPPLEWTIDGLFGVGSVNMVFGEPGSKKTWACLDMAVCIATGAPWLERATLQAPVLLVDEESGPRRLALRLGDALRGHYADENTPIAYVSLAGFNLRETAELGALQRLIGEVGARFVVIDALADVMLGADENAVQDTQPVLYGLRRVAEATQVAIVVIHHSNKAGGYRGSTAILGAVDVALEVQSKPDSAEVSFETVKMRDGEPAKFAALARFTGPMFDLAPVAARAAGVILNKGERYVLRYLEDKPDGATKTEIENHADTCTAGTARNAIYSLVERGFVARVDDGGNGSKATFCLTDSGREAL